MSRTTASLEVPDRPPCSAWVQLVLNARQSSWRPCPIHPYWGWF